MGVGGHSHAPRVPGVNPNGALVESVKVTSSSSPPSFLFPLPFFVILNKAVTGPGSHSRCHATRHETRPVTHAERQGGGRRAPHQTPQRY